MANGSRFNFDRILYLVGVVVSINVVSILGTSLLNLDERTRYKLILIQSLLTVQSVMFFTARYLFIRLCTPLYNSSSTLNLALFAFVLTVLMLAQGSIVLGTIFSGVEPHWISMLTYSSLGLFILLTTVTVTADLVTCLSGVLSVSNKSRSNSVRSQVMVVVFVSVALSVAALQNGVSEPLVKNVKIPLKNLAPEMDGFTIVHLPDLHVGPTVGKTMLDKAVRTTNHLNPDVVAITGDLVDSTVYQIRQAVKPLLKLRARYGAYFVTGNHEYYTGDVDGWLRELEYLGVTPLHNSHVMLTHHSNPHIQLCLAGVDDTEGGFFRSGDHGTDIKKALKAVNSTSPIVLLAHRPRVAKMAFECQTEHHIGLVITGHTHGGQLFPIHLWHLILEPYFAGLYKHKTGSYVYVSSGVHYWGMPMRLWSKAEITHLTLTSEPENIGS